MADDDIDLVAWIEGANREGETTIVIVAVSTFEDWVAAALRTKMRDLPSKLEERLFEGYGPLSTFSGKIDVAYAFNLFGEKTYGDLRAAKDIRNAFAHTSDPLHCKSKVLAPLFQKLSGWTKDADPKELLSPARGCRGTKETN